MEGWAQQEISRGRKWGRRREVHRDEGGPVQSLFKHPSLLPRISGLTGMLKHVDGPLKCLDTYLVRQRIPVKKLLPEWVRYKHLILHHLFPSIAVYICSPVYDLNSVLQLVTYPNVHGARLQ